MISTADVEPSPPMVAARSDVAQPAVDPSWQRPRRLAAATALVAVGAIGGGAAVHALLPASSSPSSDPALSALPVPAQPIQPVEPAQPPFDGSSGTSGAGPTNAAGLASKVSNAVVDINTTIGYEGAQAAGTGMVLTAAGEVLTNNHVIAGATSISVTDVGNGKTYKATVAGYDKSDDVAVLELKGAGGLATVTASTTPAKAGDGVVGVGNAGGTGGTPSYAAGVITRTDRPITATDDGDGTSERLTGLLETTAAIVAGDSGGPLVNAQGEVVGMDTAATAQFRFNQSSQAYAIPITTALRIAAEIETGAATSSVHTGATAMLGVGVQPGASGGAVVAGVLEGGPAAQAGIRDGDTIAGVAGRRVASAASLSRIVLGLQPGNTVAVRYLTPSGAARTATLRLASGPPQ